MKLHRPAGLAAGCSCLAALLAAPALAAGPAGVTVRAEGSSETVIEERSLRTVEGAFDKQRSNPDDPNESCSTTSAGGALDQATGGDWDGPWYSFGSYAVERIHGESHPFSGTSYWALWVNNRAVSTSLCDAELQEGDEVLFFVDRCVNGGPPSYECTNAPVRPLGLRVPATASTGAPAEVTVVRYDADGGTQAVEGARVTGPGVDATTGDGGRAAVSFAEAGQIRLKASADGYARSAPETVGVSAPGAAPVTPAAVDRTAPAGRILGIREKQRFKRGRAPRTLRGTVAPDPSGLRAVKLSLSRSQGRRCQLYSPSRERFRPSRCGRRVSFSIGDRQDWSYLLPRRLGRGRYVLDVIAVDTLGNRDRPARGRSRVVFFVR